MFGLLRWLHIGAGALALATFWIPLVATKGGAFHRKSGWVYVIAMLVAVLSAWSASTFRLLDGDPTNDRGAIFMLFLGLLAANGAIAGIRVLRTKRRTGPHRNPIDLAGPVLLLIASVAFAIYGIAQRQGLFLAFALLGSFLGSGQLRFWLRAPATAKEWWYEHLGNMLTACIGTVTAALVVNVPRLGLGDYALFFWIAPGAAGGVAITLLTRHYRRQFL